MISRYAGISRVTIHKQFKSKEDLFRAVVRQHIDESMANLTVYRNSEQNFWQETENIIQERCVEMFEEVRSALVRADLMHAGQEFCQDIIEAEESSLFNCIKLRLNKEINANRLTLERVNMSVDDFARILKSAPLGLAVSNLDINNNQFVKNLMKIFKESTHLS